MMKLTMPRRTGVKASAAPAFSCETYRRDLPAGLPVWGSTEARDGVGVLGTIPRIEPAQGTRVRVDDQEPPERWKRLAGRSVSVAMAGRARRGLIGRSGPSTTGLSACIQ